MKKYEVVKKDSNRVVKYYSPHDFCIVEATFNTKEEAEKAMESFKKFTKCDFEILEKDI